jgi:hypothetical protein
MEVSQWAIEGWTNGEQKKNDSPFSEVRKYSLSFLWK